MSLERVNSFDSKGWTAWVESDFKIGELMLYLTYKELNFVSECTDFGMGVRLIAQALLDTDLDISAKIKALYYHSKIVAPKETTEIQEVSYKEYNQKHIAMKEKEFYKIMDIPEIKPNEQTFYLSHGKSGEDLLKEQEANSNMSMDDEF